MSRRVVGPRSRVVAVLVLLCAVALIALGGSATGQSPAPPTEFPDLTAPQAAALATSEFPEVVSSPAFSLPSVPVGGELVFADDYSARVLAADGTVDGVVVSALPMRDANPQGVVAPVDLSLTDVGATLEPVNSLVGLRVHENLAGGVELGATGITLVPSDAVVASSGVEQGAVAFFANAGTDTDFVVKPVPSGFESFSTLRSSDSPTELAYHFVTPAGVSSGLSADGTRVVFTREGHVVASVSAPVATDASDSPTLGLFSSLVACDNAGATALTLAGGLGSGASSGSLDRIAVRLADETGAVGRYGNLGKLSDRADETVADVIRSRGGGAKQVNQLQTGYGERTLGEISDLAARGDREAVKAIKMVKQAGSQGKGGR